MELTKLVELRGLQLRSMAQRHLASLISEVESHELLRRLADELRGVERVNGERDLESEQIQLDLEGFAVAVALTFAARNHSERQSMLEESRIWRKTLYHDADGINREEFLRNIAFFSLRLEARFGDEGSAMEALKECQGYGDYTIWQQFDEADFFARVRTKLSKADITKMISTLESIQNDYPKEVAPSIHSKVLLLKAKFHLKRLSISLTNGLNLPRSSSTGGICRPFL